MSSKELKDGEWTGYANGVPQTIGSNSLNGTYYVFVKRLFNNVEGQNYYSTYGGILSGIGANVYQRFGPYNFDNTHLHEFYQKVAGWFDEFYTFYFKNCK